jgi:uncharacterized protein YndB with AHSA1/START domain
MPNDIRPEVGHRFTFRTAPAPGFDGIVHCEVIEVARPSRLVYSWRGGPLDTIVTWTLTAAASGGTHLRLEQDGFGLEQGMTCEMLARGWREKAAGALERVTAGLSEPRQRP